MRKYPKRQVLLSGAILVLLTGIAYWPVRHHEFVSYDVRKYVTENPHIQAGITGQSLSWALTSGHASNWHPLTWLSHMLDVECFGLNPFWHHLSNLWLHSANTLLLFLLLQSMTGAVGRSFFVAAAFGLHPLHVESVAWVAERKDVLSTLFGLLTIAAYLPYVRRGGWGRYLLMILFFSLALMAKPMLVTLPFVLLILDWWPLGRLRKRQHSRKNSSKTTEFAKADIPAAPVSRLIGEKIPLLILVIISCVITYIVQQRGGSMSLVERQLMPGGLRMQNALVSYVAYLGQMFWPVDLAVLYPFPMKGLPLWQPIGALGLLALLSVFFLYQRHSRKYLLAGWLWYLGTLVPVIGLVQVGVQARADRYTYFPLIGVFIMLSWAVGEFLARRRYYRIISAAIVILLMTIMLVGTRIQLRYWRNSTTLYEHALAVTKDNFVMHYNLGVCVGDQSRLDEAKNHFEQALQIFPAYAQAHYNLGILHGKWGQLDKAIDCFRQALHFDPSYDKAYGKLGFTLQKQGRLNEAIPFYRKALQFQPDNVESINNLAWILATNPDSNIRNPSEALTLAGKACELTTYKNPRILDSLAAAYAVAGEYDRAADTARTAIALAESANQTSLSQEIYQRLQLYQAGQAYYESPSVEEAPGHGRSNSALSPDIK